MNLWSADFQASLSMDFPGKNTRVGWHLLLQGLFLTQELNPSLLHYRQILYYLCHQGSPRKFPSTSTLEFFFLVSSQFYPCISHLTPNIILILQNTHGASSTISDQIGLPSSGLLKILIASFKVVFNFFFYILVILLSFLYFISEARLLQKNKFSSPTVR